MKNIINQIIESDTTYNKSATRYLYKSHPNLWQQILDATSFLPADSKPKQRIWHILNDIYTRPTCPITGEFVKWWENRYLETFNRSAKSQYLHKSGVYDHIYSDELKQKRRTAILESFKTGKAKPHKWTKKEIDARYEKIKATMLKKYGVVSNLALKENKEKEYQTKVAKGLITPKEKRLLRSIYYAEVKKITTVTWIEHFDKINPSRLCRGNDWHLDHIYSVQQGFRNNIPPYIIGHWTNLRILSGSKNSSKGMKCDKTKDQLFEDFFKNLE
jgi:hypothetical protein